MNTRRKKERKKKEKTKKLQKFTTERLRIPIPLVYVRACVRVSFTHIGPKFHGRKSSLATRPRNPSRSDSDEEEARDETPSSQVVRPGNAAKKTGSDRRWYPSCVAHGHVGAGMRALVPGPFPKVRHTAARSSQTSPSLRNSTGLACTMFFAHERRGARTIIESKGIV